MYSEEETELRDLIMQNLENCGFLNKIKAELRAGVFLAFEEDGNLKTKIPLCNQKFDNFINTSDGKIMISLVREFLEYYELNFTLSVFDPEVGSAVSCIPRSKLCEQLNVNNLENDRPVLLTLLKDTIVVQDNSSFDQLSNEISSANQSIKMTSSEMTANAVKDLNHENDNHVKKTLKGDSAIKNSKCDLNDTFNTSETFPVKNPEVKTISKQTFSDKLIGKEDFTEKDNTNSIFKESIDSGEHDPFYDEPLPPEKNFFSLSEPLKEKSEKLVTNSERDLEDSKKTSLTSLRDLPSLPANNEWTYGKDAKNTLPSLDSLKSISSSDTSNEEIINLDSKEAFHEKHSNLAESNEDSSEKQNSEESIEEEIEEDYSGGFDDLLSMSLADDVTTDQTVSQVSVVEGVDHVEPCK